MNHHDVELLRTATITRVAVTSDTEITLYTESGYFVIAAGIKSGLPILELQAVKALTPRLVTNEGRGKPRPKAQVYDLADYRNRPENE